MTTNIETIRKAVRTAAQKRGYELEERKSSTTNSWYFKISTGDESLLFRISDHKTETNVITLRLDKKTSYKNIVGFIDNRCNDLSARVIKKALGLK